MTQGTTRSRSLTYDAAGNVTRDVRSEVTYAYRINSAGRLDRVTVGGTIKGQYTYDSRERLAIRKRLNATPSGTAHLFHHVFILITGRG